MINRIIIIGNGFDLAHGLKTSYAHFIYSFWEKTLEEIFCSNFEFPRYPVFEKDLFLNTILKENEINQLRSLKNEENPGKNIIKFIISHKILAKKTMSFFFHLLNKNVEYKNWVDIEEEYYRIIKYIVFQELEVKNNIKFDLGERRPFVKINDLNNQLGFLKENLVNYLSKETEKVYLNKEILKLIKSPIRKEEIETNSLKIYEEYCSNLLNTNGRTLRFQWAKFNINERKARIELDKYQKLIKQAEDEHWEEEILFPESLVLPNNILLLNFNYTKTGNLYLDSNNPFLSINHIHGNINNPNNIIFGFGDELDQAYNNIRELNDNEYLENIKSIKYLETKNYKNLLKFMESAPFQIYIFGHSCGNSDRTLLNTMFEHKNCLSIKPFYYKIDEYHDNYLDLIKNISRNFTNMKLMRDRVVNKELCSPLPQC